MWPFMIDFSDFAKNINKNNSDNNNNLNFNPSSEPNPHSNNMSNQMFDWYKVMFSQAEQMWSSILNTNISSQDRRFSSHSWQDNGVYQYLANSYLLSCKQIIDNINTLDLAEDEKAKYLFFTKQYLDAISPSNFIATNPQAIQAIIDSNGQSIIDGMTNYMADLQKGRITQTKDNSFIIGENIATTAGDIIEKTPLFELIRYKNDNITQLNPLIIVPPCINKYYILDLQKHNSLVNYLVGQGFDVYLVSWKNIQEGDNNFTWDNYIQAIQSCIHKLSEQQKVHLLGFCIGGTLSSCAIAADEDINNKIASLTLLTTLLDFTNSGVLKLLIDEMQFNCRKPSLLNNGIMKGAELASIFNALRPQELIWKYVTENYLQGKTPASFDILHWNSDSTNLSGAMYAWYIENTYLKNNLVNNQAIVNGKQIDINRINNLPIYAIGCEEDHIVPWQGALQSMQHLADNNEVTFVLSSSGHIAGIVNPPTPNSKRHYYVLDMDNCNNNHDYKQNKLLGSWWDNWSNWLVEHSVKINSKNKKSIKKHVSLYETPSRYAQEKC
jgi:polyhydroxyalkanoate synthase